SRNAKVQANFVETSRNRQLNCKSAVHHLCILHNFTIQFKTYALLQFIRSETGIGKKSDALLHLNSTDQRKRRGYLSLTADYFTTLTCIGRPATLSQAGTHNTG
ncbi:MAG: hypothetical protein E6Z15_13240, partial [Paenibacillus macerans]|nr:hypothetical protein [Paenibacillus macerans]